MQAHASKPSQDIVWHVAVPEAPQFTLEGPMRGVDPRGGSGQLTPVRHQGTLAVFTSTSMISGVEKPQRVSGSRAMSAYAWRVRSLFADGRTLHTLAIRPSPSP